MHKIVTTRDKRFSSIIEFRNYKLVYRRYASLYISFCLDVNDNELLYLATIHLFIELLDKYFEPVCEVDLLLQFNKVRTRRHALSPCFHRLPRQSANYAFTLALFRHVLTLLFCCSLCLFPFPTQIYTMVDEMFLAGEVQETSKRVMLDRIAEIERIES